MGLQELGLGCGLDGLANNSDVASSCEHGDEPSVSIKFELFAEEILAFQEENIPCSQPVILVARCKLQQYVFYGGPRK